jgi:prevent-host-death family protein
LRAYRIDTISASDAKVQFSALLDKVQTEPVIISKHGRPAVMMLAAEFDTRLSFRPQAPEESNQPKCYPQNESVSINDA